MDMIIAKKLKNQFKVQPLFLNHFKKPKSTDITNRCPFAPPPTTLVKYVASFLKFRLKKGEFHMFKDDKAKGILQMGL